MKKLASILFCFLAVSVSAQNNLVSNPSFENGAFRIGTRELKKPGYLATDWYSPLHKRSPHLFRSPSRSVAKANSGDVAMGLILGGKKQSKTNVEYITGKLNQPLVAGQAYCVSFHMLLHRSSRWAANNVGVLFHHDEKLIADVELCFVVLRYWVRFSQCLKRSGVWQRYICEQ